MNNTVYKHLRMQQNSVEFYILKLQARENQDAHARCPGQEFPADDSDLVYQCTNLLCGCTAAVVKPRMEH